MFLLSMNLSRLCHEVTVKLLVSLEMPSSPHPPLAPLTTTHVERKRGGGGGGGEKKTEKNNFQSLKT